MSDPVQEDIKETLIETGRRLRTRANGPSADMLTALSKLGNTYYKLRYGKSAPEKPGRSPGSTPRKEDMSPEAWLEYCYEYGEPGAYEALCE